MHELLIALGEIKGLPWSVTQNPIVCDICGKININYETSSKLSVYIDRMNAVQTVMNKKLDRLDALIVKCSDYENYSDEDKEFVEKMILEYELLLKSVELKISNDGKTISRECQRTFAKIESVITQTEV